MYGVPSHYCARRKGDMAIVVLGRTGAVVSLKTGMCECVQKISSADVKRGYVYTPSHFRTYFGCTTRHGALLSIEDMQKVRVLTSAILLLSRLRQSQNVTKVGRK